MRNEGSIQLDRIAQKSLERRGENGDALLAIIRMLSGNFHQRPCRFIPDRKRIPLILNQHRQPRNQSRLGLVRLGHGDIVTPTAKSALLLLPTIEPIARPPVKVRNRNNNDLSFQDLIENAIWKIAKRI